MLADKFKKEFVPRLGERVARLGFSPKTKQGSFLMQKGDATIGIGARPLYYPPVLETEVSCVVRLGAVQDLLVDIGYIQARRPSDLTWTLGVNIGELVVGHYNNYQLSPERDLDGVADEISEHVQSFGFPYFLSRCTERQVFKLAYDSACPYKLDFLQADNQALVAMILAERLGEAEKIPEIFEYASRAIQNEWQQRRFKEHYKKLERLIL